MKEFAFVLVCIISSFFISCKVSDDNTYLCVFNSSVYENLYITEIYVMEKDSSGYERVWVGSLGPGKSEMVKIDDGQYSVKIRTADISCLGFEWYYTTGYNVYKKAGEGDTINATFDGDGIYFN